MVILRLYCSNRFGMVWQTVWFVTSVSIFLSVRIPKFIAMCWERPTDNATLANNAPTMDWSHENPKGDVTLQGIFMGNVGLNLHGGKQQHLSCFSKVKHKCYFIYALAFLLLAVFVVLSPGKQQLWPRSMTHAPKLMGWGTGEMGTQWSSSQPPNTCSTSRLWHPNALWPCRPWPSDAVSAGFLVEVGICVVKGLKVSITSMCWEGLNMCVSICLWKKEIQPRACLSL